MIYIIDEIMGAGKTTALINHINKSPEDMRFLFITPYLDEVERVIQSCPEKNFRQPQIFGTKLNGIKKLFADGANIASTHKMFSFFDEEVIEMAYEKGYTLIMDEVMNVIEPLDISRHDMKDIMNNYTHVGEDGKLIWHVEDYVGEFDEYKKMCDSGCVAVYSEDILLWMFPVNTFMAFKDIYILTYLFDAQIQKYYYSYYDLDITNKYIGYDSNGDYCLVDEKLEKTYPDYSNLIHICDSPTLNKIGDISGSLSLNWYKRHDNKELMHKLKNNTTNYFKNITKTRSSQNLWTSFIKYRKSVSGKGYSKGFISLATRATNKYKDRIAVAYLVNRYINPIINNFFYSAGIYINNDMYALSEMLQFIWRSAIRDKKEIYLYIPSRRMRNLLLDWMEQFKPREVGIDEGLQ